jgi:intein-encoded DNA endonuclease-like protein
MASFANTAGTHFTSIGEEFDWFANYEQKADYHAISSTKDYLDSMMDEYASTLLKTYFQHHSSTVFYRKFFHRHAVVFAKQPGTMSEWNCRNVSACVVALIRELS